MTVAATLTARDADAYGPPNLDDEGKGIIVDVDLDVATLTESNYVGQIQAADPSQTLESFFCEMLEESSFHVWRMTEGQMYFRDVTLNLGIQGGDIAWVFNNGRSIAHHNGLGMTIARNNPPGAENTLARAATLTAHETGHWALALLDEYSKFRETDQANSWGCAPVTHCAVALLRDPSAPAERATTTQIAAE